MIGMYDKQGVWLGYSLWDDLKATERNSIRPWHILVDEDTNETITRGEDNGN